MSYMLTVAQDDQRPIVFICHSLGGIVAKQVMFIKKNALVGFI
jgi:predicted alpha/beta hydrolase family esterase